MRQLQIQTQIQLQVLIPPSILAVHKNSPELTPITKQLSLAFFRQLVSHECCLIKAVFFFLYHITIAECKTYTAAGVIPAQVVAVFNSQGTHTLHTGFPSQVHKVMVWQWHQPGNNNCLPNLLLLIPKEIRICLRSSNGTITPRKGSCDVAL